MAAVRVRRVVLVAPMAVRVRTSPAASARIRPTHIASTPSAISAPAAVATVLIVASEAWVFLDSMTRPDLAAASRAAAICAAGSGRADSTIQPDWIWVQCQWRSPFRVISEVGSEP